MTREDAWDWPLLMYTATVVLRMTEAQFWKITPRKLNALTQVHVEVNSNEKKQKPRFIDEVF